MNTENVQVKIPVTGIIMFETSIAIQGEHILRHFVERAIAYKILLRGKTKNKY
jgi:hypothetical protein